MTTEEAVALHRLEKARRAERDQPSMSEAKRLFREASEKVETSQRRSSTNPRPAK